MSIAVVSKWIVPPVIGALIGYCTNLIAVKMLFFPHNEKRIGSFRVPFTPGVIPKSQPRLARAVGNIVAGELITADDITARMLSEDIQEPVVRKAMKFLSSDIRDSAGTLLGNPDAYPALKDAASTALAESIMDAVRNMNIPDLVQREGRQMVGGMLAQNPMLGMFVTPELVDSLLQTIGGKMYEFVETKGAPAAGSAVRAKADSLDGQSVTGLLNSMGYDEAFVESKVRDIYRNAAGEVVGSAVQKLDIAKVIEDKINAMPVKELEDGVLMVMKNELDMIVRLGALIGFILGCINLLL